MAFSLLAEFLYDLNAQFIFLQHFFLFCLFIFLRHLRISAFEILLHVQTIRSSFLILGVIRMAGWRGFCLTSIKALYTTQNRETFAVCVIDYRPSLSTQLKLGLRFKTGWRNETVYSLTSCTTLLEIH